MSSRTQDLFTRSTPAPSATLGLMHVTVAAVLWGTTGVVVQVLRDSTSLSAVSIGFYRLGIAAAVMLLLSTHRLGLLLTAVRAVPGPLLLIGLGLAMYQAAYFWAVTAAGVSVATVVSLGLAPVLTAGWEAARGRRLPGLSTIGTLAAAVVGLALISASSTHASPAAPRPMLGLPAAAASGVGYAATTVLSRHVAQQVSPRELTTVSTAVGAVALAPLAAMGGVGLTPAVAPLALLGYLGLITTAVAYALFYAGLRTTSGSSAAVLTLLEPLTAALLAVLLLSEPLPWVTLVGGALLLSAVAALYAGAAGPTRPTQPRRAASRRDLPCRLDEHKTTSQRR